MKMVITGTIFFNENSGAEIHIVDEYKHCENDVQVEEIVSKADVHGIDWIIVQDYNLPIRTSINVPLVLVDYINTRNKQKGFIN